MHCCFRTRAEQALMLWLFSWMVLIWPFAGTGLLLCLLVNASLWPLSVAYLAWLAYDFRTPSRGSRPSRWARNWRIWSAAAEYFPIETVKTADLPPDRNYVIAAHPHGILATSSALAFGSNGSSFHKTFPQLCLRVATLPINFVFPFRRECLISLGVISCSAHSIGHVLDLPSSGNAVAIVPGGVAEMLLSGGERHQLVLANRKGFVKLAIKHGSALVPVYHFGENELFSSVPMPEGSLVHTVQMRMKHLMGCYFPLSYGRSFLSLLLPEKFARQLPPLLRHGIIPFRRRVVTVVGAPISVTKNPHPSQAEIDAVHAEYCQRLRELFDRYKCQHGGLPESAQLELV